MFENLWACMSSMLLNTPVKRQGELSTTEGGWAEQSKVKSRLWEGDTVFEETSRDEKIYGVINVSGTFGLFIAVYTLL